MAGKTSSKGQKDQYSKYKTEHRWEKNKIKKLQKHSKNHPNDSIALKKLEHMNFKYPRKIPGDHKPPEPKRIKCFSERCFIPKSITEQINAIWVWNVL